MATIPRDKWFAVTHSYKITIPRSEAEHPSFIKLWGNRLIWAILPSYGTTIPIRQNMYKAKRIPVGEFIIILFEPSSVT
uniref:Uncharacterized protein n=1 Tax=viral metagenome TaxID=1070528 RepID=A0A6M3M207_9ZZZZ